jgi:uncharacterized membrane protein
MCAWLRAVRSRWAKLAGTLLLSWGLLVWRLGERSLWVDEFLTLQMIGGRWPEVIAVSVADKHPPLYFIALHGWVSLVGSSDFALRLFSVMTGLVGVALMASLTRRLIGSRAVVPGVFALGIAPAFIAFSRMARYYALLLSLGLLSTCLLLRALAGDRRQDWIAYTLASLVILYTFYPGAILIGAHAVIVLFHRRRRVVIGRWLVAVFLVSVGFLPWLFCVAGGQVVKVAGSLGADLSRSVMGFMLGVASALYTFGVGETLFPWRPEAWIGLIVVLVLLGVGFVRERNRKLWQSFGLFLISILFMSTVTTFVSTSTPFLNVPVRSLFALPYYLLVIVAGFISVRSEKWQGVLACALLVVWGISISNNLAARQFLNPIYITPSKEAAVFVRQKANAGDLVISDYDSVFGHYFLTDEPSPRHLYTRDTDRIQTALRVSAPERVWFVTIGRDQTRRYASAETVRRLLVDTYRLESVMLYLPLDPVYLKVKSFLLRRNSYEYRLTVETYARDGQ